MATRKSPVDLDEEVLQLLACLTHNKAVLSRKLIRAVCCESERKLKMLLKSCCKGINHANGKNETALSMACRTGNKTIIALLLQHGANPNIGTSPLIEAYNAQHMQVVDLLLNKRCDPDRTDTRGDTLLLSALRSSRENEARDTDLEQLINMLRRISHVNVNIIDFYGVPLLHLAVVPMLKASFVIPFLLKNEANLSSTDTFGQTLLYRLCDVFYQFHEFLRTSKSLVNLAFKQLLYEHIDVNHQDGNGHTVMHYFLFKVAQYSYSSLQIRNDMFNALLGVCKFLLHLEPDLCIKDKFGFTVYHLATCNTKLFDVLINHSRINFHENELSLLLKMSRSFNTSFHVRKLLEINDYQFYDNPTPTVNTYFPPTPYYNEGLASWISRLGTFMPTVDHKKLLLQIMDQNMMCSYPQGQIEEMQEQANTVLSFFKSISEEISKSDILMAFTPHISGSCIEGTKVESPDEMDILCVLHNINFLSCNDGDKRGFVKISTVNIEAETFKDTFGKIYIAPSSINTCFYQCVVKAIQNTAIWKKYVQLAYVQEDCDVILSPKHIGSIKFLWCGKYFPFLKFKVDVVPSISTNNWLPEYVVKDPLILSLSCLLIPKLIYEKGENNNQFFSSFERSELAVFSIMPDALKQAYMLAKIVIRIIDHEGNFDNFRQHKRQTPSSYILKTVTLPHFSPP